MDLYTKSLIQIESILGNSMTNSEELFRMAVDLFGRRFKGVFAYDESFKLTNGELAIFNLDPISRPGSHWCAVVYDNIHYITYDSFGRAVTLKTDNVMTENDAEQMTNEHNCGQRCIAWLIVYVIRGAKIALTI